TTVGTLRLKLDVSNFDATKLDKQKLDTVSNLDATKVDRPKLDTQKLDVSNLDKPKTGQLIDLATAPLSEIDAVAQTLSPERRAALVRLWVPPRHDHGPCRKHDHVAILAAKACGMSMQEISEKFGVPYRTVVWVVAGKPRSPNRAEREGC